MNNLHYRLTTLAALALALDAAGAQARMAVVAAGRQLALPSSAIIPVTLGDNLSSYRSWRGEAFGTTVVTGGAGASPLPKGTRISGKILAVGQPRVKGDAGVLDLEFTTLTLPDESRYALTGRAVFDPAHPRTAHPLPGTRFGVRVTRSVTIRSRDLG